MPYPLPTEHERRALFGWLEQASSLTAWRRLYTYHQRFVDEVRGAYEEEQQTPGIASTISTDWLAAVLASHGAFAAALERLQRGDRRCFDFLGARGHFSKGIEQVEWWEDMYGGYYYGRNGFDVADSPRWPRIMAAMHECLAALSDIGVVLQERHTDVPAAIEEVSSRLISNSEDPIDNASSLFKWWASQPQLPPVPIAEPEVLVRTGSNIPSYGIWEPVVVERHPGVIGAFRAPLPAPAVPGPNHRATESRSSLFLRLPLPEAQHAAATVSPPAWVRATAARGLSGAAARSGPHLPPDPSTRRTMQQPD